MPNLPGSVSWTHNHSIPPIKFVVERVESVHIHVYDISAITATRTHTHKWNINIRVGPRTRTHKFTITQKALTTKKHRWNSGGRVRKLKTHKWHTFEIIPSTKTHKWNRIVQVTKTKTHKYNGIGRLIRTHTHKWTSGGIVKGIVHIHKYNVVKGVLKTKTHKWNIYTPKITDANLEYFKSSNTADSLGGAIDTNAPIIDNTKSNLFDEITATESTSGDIEYRCLYVRNISPQSVLLNSKVWIQSNTPSSFTDVTIGLGTSAIAGTEQTVANEGTAPTTVTFSTANGLNNALSIGTLTAGQHKAVWIKRVVNSGSTVYENDNFILAFAGDTFASE